jgi:hypothetical protein
MNDDGGCKKIRDLLDGGSLGGLSPAEIASLEAHAATCEQCRMLLKMNEHLAFSSRGDLEARVPARLVAGMWERVAGRLDPHRSAGAGRLRPDASRWPRQAKANRWLVPALSASTGAFFLIILALLLHIHGLRASERALASALEEKELLLENVRQPALEFPVAASAAQSLRRSGLQTRAMRNGLSIAELKSILAQMPPDMQLLTTRDIDRIRSRLPHWQELVVGEKLRGIDYSDGLQSSEALQLIESLSLDPQEIIPPSQLLAFADMRG